MAGTGCASVAFTNTATNHARRPMFKGQSQARYFPPAGSFQLFAVFVLFFFMAATGLVPSAQSASNPRYASIVMDADTGMILSERYADKSLHPASLAKMMTLLMTFEALEKGRLRLRDRVPVSKHAASMVPSKLNLPVGSTIRVEDAIYALTTKSANDVAVALAEKIGGTESHFAVMMTRKAREMGMTRTQFRNASGLHHSRQVSTARDMAKLARYLIKEYPEYYHYFSTEKFTYQGHTYRNHNRLMETYRGMDGMKTGYIQASGFNLVSSAKRGNRRLIGVVFGGRTSRSRNDHMKVLLDRGFTKIEEVLVASSAPLVAPLPGRKPHEDFSVASLESKPTSRNIAQIAINSSYKEAVAKLLEGRAFSSMIGEGDFDPAVSRRFETGLMAISAVRQYGMDVPPVSDDAVKALNGNWAIQIGAFHSRVKTDKAINHALASLPAAYKKDAVATIVPLRTDQGWLFRGRLNGYTEESAAQACSYLQDCLPVSPSAY